MNRGIKRADLEKLRAVRQADLEAREVIRRQTEVDRLVADKAGCQREARMRELRMMRQSSCSHSGMGASRGGS